MRQAVIVANGEMTNPSQFIEIIKSSTLVISADGGINNCAHLGIKPHVIIGDLDSFQPELLATYRDQGVEILQFPTHKDETDLELAIRYVIDKGFDEIIILGALGARWDMTIANILLIAHPKYRGIHIRILDGHQELGLLLPGEETHISGSPGDTISLIPLYGDAFGITTSGLEYPLKDETLAFGATRGVSNVLLSEGSDIFLRQGLVLCVINRISPLWGKVQD